MSGVVTAAPPKPPPSPPGWSVSAPPPPEPPKRSGGGGATAGIVLIVIGVVLLADRFLPWFSWWALWPLVIIVAGIVQGLRPDKEGWSVARLFDGLVTVAIGGVFLAITSDVVSWDVWVRILAFWPVLLISIGLEMLGSALHASWPRVVGSLAIIAVLVSGVVAASPDLDNASVPDMGSGGTEFAVTEPLLGAEQADLDLRVGVARVDLGAGDALVTITGRSSYGAPVVDVDRSVDPVEVDVRLGGESLDIRPGSASASFDVGLSDGVLWDLRVEAAVSELDADLSGVPVRALDLRPGVASCDVKLGHVPYGVPEARVKVRAGVSSGVLRVPADAQVRVEIESGLSGNTVRGRFEKRSTGVWETPGYRTARQAGRPVWLVSVNSGVGSITIETY